MFEEVNAKTPLIFLLSTGTYCCQWLSAAECIPGIHSSLPNEIGSDPTSQILKFARDTRGSTLHLDMVSLGRGQGPKAEELINKAQILKGALVL